MIYLASPYSHPDKAVEAYRYDEAVRALAWMCKRTFAVFCPIAMCHVAAMRHGLPTDAEWWASFNLAFMSRSTNCAVLMIDGWDTSLGVAREIEWFRSQPLPVRGLRPVVDSFEWVMGGVGVEAGNV